MDTINMCNICHRIFNRNINLLKHFETHAFMPRCEKCKHRFPSSIDLKNHKENVHKRSIEREPRLRTKPNKSKNGIIYIYIYINKNFRKIHQGPQSLWWDQQIQRLQPSAGARKGPRSGLLFQYIYIYICNLVAGQLCNCY